MVEDYEGTKCEISRAIFDMLQTSIYTHMSTNWESFLGFHGEGKKGIKNTHEWFYIWSM